MAVRSAIRIQLTPSLAYFPITIFPDSQPFDNFIYFAIALLIVWLISETIFDKEAGVTNELLDE